jgi:NAD-dependent SIR2 family protein deacetylase
MATSTGIKCGLYIPAHLKFSALTCMMCGGTVGGWTVYPTNFVSTGECEQCKAKYWYDRGVLVRYQRPEDAFDYEIPPGTLLVLWEWR